MRTVRYIMVAALLSAGLLGTVTSAAERTSVLPLKVVHADLPLPGKPDQAYVPINQQSTGKAPLKKISIALTMSRLIRKGSCCLFPILGQTVSM